MYTLTAWYKHFEWKQTPNIYYYHNNLICRYLRRTFDWFGRVSKDRYKEVMDRVRKIWSIKGKEHIEPYYKVYSHYLAVHTDIFTEGKSFIDCGCAPGGFLKFAGEQRMTGSGITLKPTKENKAIDMQYSANIIYGDLLDDDFVGHLPFRDKVDFVNMGAVYYEDDKSNENRAKLFLNQFYIAQKHLKKGGSMMFVLDVFHTLVNFVEMFDFFIGKRCEVFMIPVQPAFKGTHVYVLVKHIEEFTKADFEKIVIMKQTYKPVTHNYLMAAKRVFAAASFDVASFIDAYHICLFAKIEPTNNTIGYNMIPILYLDQINRTLYNYRYLKFADPFIKLASDVYPTEYRKKITNRVAIVRDKFIKKNGLTVDAIGNIETNVDGISPSEINRTAKRIILCITNHK